MPGAMKRVRALEGMEEAEMVYGVYDTVAKVKAVTMDQLKHIIAYNIRTLQDVRSTQTMLGIPQFSF
jgi:DNA-binding Lrp family transcriptional regulator